MPIKRRSALHVRFDALALLEVFAIMIVVPALLSFVITVAFIAALRPVATALGLVDIPGGRKRHDVPVPIIGGVAMSIGLGAGVSLIDVPDFLDPALLGIYLLVAVGVIDDRIELPVNLKLIAQSCAALLVVAGSGLVVTNLGAPFFQPLELGAIAVPLTVVFIVTLVNAFNIVDGIDGLAGALALVSLLGMMIIGIETPVFPLILVTAAAVLGFLLFNLPLGFNSPIRTFMGDAGSTVLGLIVASVGILLSQGTAPRVSPVVGLWLLCVPVFDLLTSVVRRLLERRSPFAPDHAHLHHVLIDNGLSRSATLVWIVSFAVLLGAVGIAGDLLAVPDGVMMLLWAAAGALYYQMMRHPRDVVRFVSKMSHLFPRPRRLTAK